MGGASRLRLPDTDKRFLIWSGELKSALMVRVRQIDQLFRHNDSSIPKSLVDLAQVCVLSLCDEQLLSGF